MKVYKIEILILDYDQVGDEGIKEVIENQRYPNYCISPRVMEIQSADIGEWKDDNPLNRNETMKPEYVRLFNPAKKSL